MTIYNTTRQISRNFYQAAREATTSMLERYSEIVWWGDSIRDRSALRALLKAADITSMVGQNLATETHFVRVMPEDAERARAIINAHTSNTAQTPF